MAGAPTKNNLDINWQERLDKVWEKRPDKRIGRGDLHLEAAAIDPSVSGSQTTFFRKLTTRQSSAEFGKLLFLTAGLEVLGLSEAAFLLEDDARWNEETAQLDKMDAKVRLNGQLTSKLSIKVTTVRPDKLPPDRRFDDIESGLVFRTGDYMDLSLHYRDDQQLHTGYIILLEWSEKEQDWQLINAAKPLGLSALIKMQFESVRDGGKTSGLTLEKPIGKTTGQFELFALLFRKPCDHRAVSFIKQLKASNSSILRDAELVRLLNLIGDQECLIASTEYTVV